jgi:hypothetical protein
MCLRGPQAAPDGVPHPPRGRDLGVGDLGRQHGARPECPAGDVGRQGSGERRLGLLEGQEPGGEVPALGLGEPGADRAEVLQPVRPRRPGQDRSRQLGAGVAQIRYESGRSGSGGNSGGMARLKHATRPHGNEITGRRLRLSHPVADTAAAKSITSASKR